MIRQIIPDIHGRNVSDMKAKKVKTILLGDYWDSFDIPFEKQVESFYEWMKFAEDTNSICLIGNHDEHYFDFEPTKRGSGFQEEYKLAIKYILESFKDKLQYAYYDKHSRVLYSHAGMCQDYLDELVNKFGVINSIELLVEIINANPAIDFYSKGIGDVMWFRPDRLYCSPDLLEKLKINQVVGHTFSKNTIRQFHNLHIVDIGRAVDINELNLHFR